MKRLQNIQKAFTMIELVFVIVILGIVSSIGSGIIANVYENYIVQRSVHDGSIKTELAINQLANRLTYRIDKTMIARIPQVAPAYTFPPAAAAPTAYDARQVPLNRLDSHSALEWIGYDNDHFSAYANPTWSGFADINTTGSSTFVTLNTPGSNTANFTNYYTAGQARAIRFMGTQIYQDDSVGNIDDYNVACMYQNNGCMFPVTTPTVQTLQFVGGDRTLGWMRYTEFYQLASSAFAVVPENLRILPNTNVTVYDLVLYYAYQPWLGEHYRSGNRSVLLTDVSVFRFKKESNSIRIKLCSVERIGDQETIAICKEKAVIR